MNDCIKVIWISNVVLQHYLYTRISSSFANENVKLMLHYISYDEYLKEITKLVAVDYVVISLNFDVLYPNAFVDILSSKVLTEEIELDLISKCRGLYSDIKKLSCAPIFWFGFEDYCYNRDVVCGTVPLVDDLVDRGNFFLKNILFEDVYIDLKRLIAKLGIGSAYSNKGKNRWNAPYSEKVVSLMADEVYKQYLVHTGQTKKCIVLDCDNVLWGGILSENGIEGIQLGNSGKGKSFIDFQRFLLMLYYQGVILTICSKNDETDVLKVFREHDGMLLKEKHISYFCCNWDNKPSNIRVIADILNIGLNSIVFIDDSEFELNSVNAILPEVETIIYNCDTIYNSLSCFNLKSKVDIENISTRADTYRTNVERIKLKESSNSFEEYLSSLNIKIDIHRTIGVEIVRLSELTQRTNKCTNGIRYTVEQLKEKLQCGEYELYTVSAMDKFSNLGIIGVLGLNGSLLDLFALSCRALGRKIEDSLVEFVLSKGVRRFTYKDTKKNADLLELLKKDGLLEKGEF